MRPGLRSWTCKRAPYILLALVACACGCSTTYPGAVIRGEIVPFDREQIAIARQFGVELGQPFAKAARILHRAGWKLDRSLLSENLSGNAVLAVTSGLERDGLLCGEGYDATCTARFVRNGAFLVLVVNPRVDSLSVEDLRVCQGDACP
jgi:hypothetical protein